jgi:c-di-AMP phosphodiesterase-like protein
MKKLWAVVILVAYVFICVLVIIIGSICVKNFPTHELADVIATTLVPIFMLCQLILQRHNEKQDDKEKESKV